MEASKMAKPLKTRGAPYGSRTRLFRLKSRPKFNDFKARVDSSCNVPRMEDQMLSYESTWPQMLDELESAQIGGCHEGLASPS
jgi:hypothetical protein